MTQEAGEIVNDERNYEAEARAQGWKPPEDLPENFKGDPVDAETFVKRGEQYVGFLKPRLDKVERQLQEQQQLNTDIKQQLERERKRQEAEIEKYKKELRETRKQAIIDGDGEAFDKAEQELDELNQSKPSEKSAKPELPPEVVEWQGDNNWYGKDADLTVLADKYSDILREQNPYLSGRAFLDEISEYVKRERPHKFKPSKPKAPDVEGDAPPKGGSSDEPKGNAQTYANLPADAKKECTRLMKEGIIKDKNDYARIYFEQ